MNAPEVAGYGSWKSPISSELVASGAVRLGSPVVCEGRDVYWLESRPTEGGRSVLVRRTTDGQKTDLNPEPFNVRTRVHEYGGGAYLVHDRVVFFSNFSDQKLYRLDPGEAPRPITPVDGLRYADGVYDPSRDRIICVCEDHRSAGAEPINSIVAIASLGEGTMEMLASGHDFYAAPRLSPDGARLAWLTWNHPDMPWDGTELWMGEMDRSGRVVNRTKVAGSREESVCQPRFSPDGVLCFVSDRSGWWNLYGWEDGRCESLWETDAEFAEPGWIFGLSNFDFLSSDRLVCSYDRNGMSRLATVSLADRSVEHFETPFTSIQSVTATERGVVFLGGSPTEAPAVVRMDAETGEVQVLRRSTDLAIGAEYLSVPEPLEFPSGNGQTAHALYYAPKNKDYTAPAGERPPLLVLSHGGPTSAASSVLTLGIQYWTSRGFALVDVDYGGSSGYGREYRKRLDGQWGIVDVDDCTHAAVHLVHQGLADVSRLAIRGGSAGGYTTLAALTFRNVFKAGASYYGVSDLEALTKDTHKFESRYLDGLIGPYPERRDLYEDRSPLKHVEGLSCPIIFFQGDEDEVVPPNQARMMVDALRKKGVPVAYLLFRGEQHGFRKSENIKRSLDAELYFYSRIFGFALAERLEPVEIYNL